MSKLNFLRPNIENLNTYLYSGIFLISIAILDVISNSFFNTNITSFLPNLISFLLPLILGIVGLHFIRIEFSGIKNLDLLNKNINTNTFNAVLTLLIVFAGTALMQTGRAIEIVSITMLTYLSISLSISVLMNWYNKRMAIKEK